MKIEARAIPETVAPGEPVEIQLAPFGDYPGSLRFTGPDGRPAKKRVVQRVDARTLNNVVKAFSEDVLLDRDHLSETGGDTSAFGWFKSLRVDPELGLMGTVSFTPPGAQVVNSRVYRFPSCSFDIEELADGKTVEPVRLSTVALTNMKNLPVRSVLNRADPVEPTTHVEDKGNIQMEEIAQLLGCAPDPAAVMDAVKALQQRAADAEAKVLNAEADQFVDANKGKVCNSADLKALYIESPDQARRFVGMIADKKPDDPETRKRVTNSSDASRAPRFDGTDKGDVLQVYNSMADGPEKARFLADHAQAICDARAAEQQ